MWKLENDMRVKSQIYSQLWEIWLTAIGH